MHKELMLVGSVPLETAEEVFKEFGSPLGRYLRALPDGEVGERQYWVVRMQFRVFHGHPDLETVKRPAPDSVLPLFNAAAADPDTIKREFGFASTSVLSCTSQSA